MMKKIVNFFILISLFTCFFPVVVFADTSGTYTVMHKNECYYFGSYTKNENTYNLYVRAGTGSTIDENTEYRGVVLVYSDNGLITDVNVGVVSYSGSTSAGYHRTTSSACPASTSSFSSMTAYTYPEDNHKYYYYWGNPGYYSKDINYSSDFAVVYINHAKTSIAHDLVYYTYGEGSEEPVEPINWGSLKDLSYTTAIAGGGSAAVNNKDILSWDTFYDTNYNDVSGEFVKIRVLKGSYRDSTKADLLTQAYNAIIQDTSSYNILGTYPVSQGKVSYEWSYIMNRLDYANIGLMLAHPEDDYWIKKGWIYQAQLIADDGDFEGEWQTLYTGTSASAKASEVLINSTNYDIDVYQVIQQITEANNNTSITITYIDTDITIQNPSDGTEPSGGTNLWDILKELVSGIFQIIAKLGDLVGNLIDGIMGLFQSLFTPPEVDQQINNDINIEINSYLEDDQPGLNDIHTNIDTWKLQLEDIADDYASGGDCILQWENVAMDLSVFGAGNVTFIPAGTYDLKTAFLNLLSGFGVSYSTYQMLVSAVIYISLIVLISHKVKGFLKT